MIRLRSCVPEGEFDCKARGARWPLGARLAIGAGAAVLTVATAQAAVVGGSQPWVYLTAIPAGFSERLIRRSVETLESMAGQS